MRFLLSSYTIRVERKPSNSKKQDPKPEYSPLKLDSFTDGTDFFEVIKNFLENVRKNPVADQDQKVLMGVSELNIYENDRRISGIIDNGLYGILSKLVDIDTNSLSYERKTTDAEVLPFFFLISLPKGKDEGILILGRIGTRGIRKIFSKLFARYFSKNYPGFSVSLNPLIPDKLIQQVLSRGTIKKLRFVKYTIPTDRFEILDTGHQEIEGNMEISFSGYSMPVKERLSKLFDGSKRVKNLFELREQNFEYDTIKVEVEMSGSRKIINLSNWGKVRYYIDITKDIIIKRDGFPTFSSIEAIAIKTYEDLSKLIYGR